MNKSMFGAVFAAGLACLVTLPAFAAEGDPDAGRTKFYTCLGCHGIGGHSSTYPNYHVPKVGGQHPEYLVAALQAYRSGARQHPSMSGSASSINEQDMLDIAAYLGRFRSIHERTAHAGDVEAGRKAAHACVSCHAEDGNPQDTYPRLAAQYQDYLVKVLEEYRSGTRKNAVMNGIAANLSDEDIKNISAYYASQKKGLTVVKDH